MTHAPVVDVLEGKYAVGETVTVKGWVRTRRDSKAGLSFIALHDGSCFNPVQVIALIHRTKESMMKKILCQIMLIFSD